MCLPLRKDKKSFFVHNLVKNFWFKKRRFAFFQKKSAFTFVEVMVALAILSSGIVLIFRSFVFSLNQMNHVTTRFYATNLIDNQLYQIQKSLKEYKVLPLKLEPVRNVLVGNKYMDFYQEMSISQVDEFNEIFKIDLTVSWAESGKKKNITRSSYLSDFNARLGR